MNETKFLPGLKLVRDLGLTPKEVEVLIPFISNEFRLSTESKIREISV